ncbi:hypothetical protein AVEN_74816-1 [Araneus ventricosus]|uniref:MATH domain-containing protein n=1 Tax=Araneus ventricosus TaxID=182803 RepID=A0A4Y2HP26_ARAVE|nr:hypothetical protein AVEN_74816-1 [Araneus ventricosus]
MNNGRNECIFLWFIENYSYCCHENGEPLLSPDFTFEGLEGTAWYLAVFPRGYRAEDKGNISLILYRKANDVGPEVFTIEFELSLLAVDGPALYCRDSICKFERVGFTHRHLLLGEPAPLCTACQCQMTVLHILIECQQFNHQRIRCFHTFCITLKDILHEDPHPQLFTFLKMIDFYSLI